MYLLIRDYKLLGTDYFIFSHKTWLLSMVREGASEQISGYKDHSSCMNASYEMKQCIKFTPRETDKLITRMRNIMIPDRKRKPAPA